MTGAPVLCRSNTDDRPRMIKYARYELEVSRVYRMA